MKEYKLTFTTINPKEGFIFKETIGTYKTLDDADKKMWEVYNTEKERGKVKYEFEHVLKSFVRYAKDYDTQCIIMINEK